MSEELEATHLRGQRFAVRPKGQLGTCGFYPEAWQVYYVNAGNKRVAISKAAGKVFSNRARVIHRN